ncbi:hypothetical protein RIF29_13744 [Crotalaria pallida]|uniref:Uncharacterized protein n=1 Tax=Crotalaria pallida TaxID=3830 RepID=A0AAN9IQ38_CROPI
MLEAWSSLKKSLHCSKTHSTEVHDPSRTRHHNKSSDHRKNKQSNKESSSSTTSQASRSAILNPVTHEIVFDNNSKKFCCCSIPQNNDEDGSKGVELVSHRSTKRTIISEKTHCVDCDQCGFFPSKPRVPKVKMMVQEYSPENPKSMEIVDDEDDISVENSVILLHKEDSSWQIIEKLCQTSCYTNSASNATDIECVLKVHNHHKSFSCFEECREIARTNAEKLQDKFPATRCLADGNELLRFHGTTIACSLGMNNNDGSSSPTTTSLCTLDQCGLCQILRHGFSTTNQKWVFTTSTSEKAYDFIDLLSSDELSMRKGVIVCRVIAGRIHNPLQENEEITSDSGFDTLVKKISAESDIEELYVLNPRAILPCFVVIYKS